MNGTPDAVVVGAGPNGLAAALRLAAAGLSVRVVERGDRPGGGLRTEEHIRPGYWHDICSTVHPMAAAAPFFREFDPESRATAGDRLRTGIRRHVRNPLARWDSPSRRSVSSHC